MTNLISLSQTLFIGLGSFGADTIVRLKSTLLDNFGEIPPMIKLLAMDDSYYSKKMGYKNLHGKEISLDENEFCFLDVFNTIKNHKKIIDSYPTIDSSVPKQAIHSLEIEFNLSAKMQGPAIRYNKSIQKYTFLVDVNNVIHPKLSSLIDDINNAVLLGNEKYTIYQNEPLNIFIIFSLAGATGGGLFIDLPLFLNGTGIVRQNTLINAIGLLPDVYVSLGAATANCTPNAISAITEYELIADGTLQEFIPDPSHRARLVKTPAGSYPVDPANLYDDFYLINNVSSTGVKYESANEIADIVSKSFFLEICKQEEEDEREKLLKEKEKHFEKINQRIEDKTQRYKSIGYAEMVFEPRQVASYYSLSQTKSICNNLLNEKSEYFYTRELIQSILDEWKIQKDYNRDDVINYLAEINHSQLFSGVHKFDKTASSAIKSKRYEYIKGVKELLNTTIFNPQGSLETLTDNNISRLQELASAKINSKAGIDYLKQVVPELIGRFKEMLYEITEEQKEFEVRLHAMEDKYLTLLQDIDNAINISRLNIFKNRRKAIKYACNDYANMVNEEAACIHEIEIRTGAIVFYRKMIERAGIILNRITELEDRLKQIIENTSMQIQKIRSRNPVDPYTVDVTPEYIRSITISSNDDNTEMDVFFKSGLIADYTFGPNSDASELFNAITDYTNKLSTTRIHIETTIFDVLEKMNPGSVRDFFGKIKGKLGVLRQLNNNYPLDIWRSYGIGIYSIQHKPTVNQGIATETKNDAIGEMDFELSYSGQMEGNYNKKNKYQPTVIDVLKSEFGADGRLPELSVTNDPCKIMFVAKDSKAPAFLIKNFEKYAFDLKQKKSTISEELLYSNKHWGDIIMQRYYSIFPKNEDDAIKAWAMAFLVTKVEKDKLGKAALEFVKKTKNGKYAIFSTFGDKAMYDLHAYRPKAYEMFKENQQFVYNILPILQQKIKGDPSTFRAKLEVLKNNHDGNIYVDEYSSHCLGRATYFSDAHEATRLLIMEEFRFLYNIADISDLIM